MSRTMLVVMLLGVGCRATTPQGPNAPVSVAWVVVAQTATGARLEAHIRRAAPVPYPLGVTLEVPEGVTVLSGHTAFDVPANASADEVVEPLELTYAHVPAKDLLLRLVGGTRAIGVSAAVPYRFGRASPTLQHVAPSGESVVINGRDLGPSISLNSR